MAKASFGVFVLRAENLKHARDAVVSALEHGGYRVTRKKANEQQVRVEGVRGSKLLATAIGMVPFAALLGFGSRVQATVVCRTSLNAGDPTLRISVRCAPLRELTDEEETFYATQGLAEYLGDHLQTRRCYQSLLGALKSAGLLAPA